MVMVWSSWRYRSATKLKPVVTTMSSGAEASAPTAWPSGATACSANGHSTTALNTTWPTKRSQVTCGDRHAPPRRPDISRWQSSAAKQIVASDHEPDRLQLWRGSAGAREGAGRHGGVVLHQSLPKRHRRLRSTAGRDGNEEGGADVADVRAMCAIGQRGQLGLNGRLPWEGNKGTRICCRCGALLRRHARSCDHRRADHHRLDPALRL